MRAITFAIVLAFAATTVAASPQHSPACATSASLKQSVCRVGSQYLRVSQINQQDAVCTCQLWTGGSCSAKCGLDGKPMGCQCKH